MGLPGIRRNVRGQHVKRVRGDKVGFSRSKRRVAASVQNVPGRMACPSSRGRACPAAAYAMGHLDFQLTLCELVSVPAEYLAGSMNVLPCWEQGAQVQATARPCGAAAWPRIQYPFGLPGSRVEERRPRMGLLAGKEGMSPKGQRGQGAGSKLTGNKQQFSPLDKPRLLAWLSQTNRGGECSA